jgi:hypothetical protein
VDAAGSWGKPAAGGGAEKPNGQEDRQASERSQNVDVLAMLLEDAVHFGCIPGRADRRQHNIRSVCGLERHRHGSDRFVDPHGLMGDPGHCEAQ